MSSSHRTALILLGDSPKLKLLGKVLLSATKSPLDGAVAHLAEHLIPGKSIERHLLPQI